MALAKNVAVMVVVMAALCGISFGCNSFKVGDSAGWIPAFDYQKWARDKDFQVGDTLKFKYDPQVHNVMEVTAQEFESCQPSTAIGTYTSGEDKVLLATPGDHFFICRYHCIIGMKLKVTVPGSGGDPQVPPPQAGSDGNPQVPPPQGGSGGDRQVLPPQSSSGGATPTSCIESRTLTYVPGCVPTLAEPPNSNKGVASVSSAWGLVMLGVFAAATA